MASLTAADASKYVTKLNCLKEFLCDKGEAFYQVLNLDVSKASGQDGISAHMLKCTAITITPIFKNLFKSID